jgi:hypothetical protein
MTPPIQEPSIKVGQLSVVGKGDVKFHVREFPVSVKVDFTSPPPPPPVCGPDLPCDYVDIDIEVKTHHGKTDYLVTIEWEVFGTTPREIEWALTF